MRCAKIYIYYVMSFARLCIVGILLVAMGLLLLVVAIGECALFSFLA